MDRGYIVMKKLNQYQCDICNTVYNNENDCKRCENSHKIPVKIIGYKFNAIRNNGEYPKTVTMEFSDGTNKVMKCE